MEKRTVTIDFDELEMAMQDRDVSWCIDPATGNTCLESEEAELLHGADDAELMRPTDPDDVLELPPLFSSDGADPSPFDCYSTAESGESVGGELQTGAKRQVGVALDTA